MISGAILAAARTFHVEHTVGTAGLFHVKRRVERAAWPAPQGAPASLANPGRTPPYFVSGIWTVDEHVSRGNPGRTRCVSGLYQRVEHQAR
jgi:hypothetical protein